jgi:HEPN domain-containing protein
MCHLSIEKALKALVVQETKETPPKTHDLGRLADLAGIVVPEHHQAILTHLKEASVPTRYPEDMSKLVKHYNKAAAERYLAETKGLWKWLKTRMK